MGKLSDLCKAVRRKHGMALQRLDSHTMPPFTVRPSEVEPEWLPNADEVDANGV